MPTDNPSLNPPVQYSLLWLIIGIALVLGILGWYGLLFWLTRRRKVNSLANQGLASSGSDLDRLKQKYLALIDECYQSYSKKQTSLRGLHRGLSMTVRYFVFEAKHFPAPRLTLSDLKRAPYPHLTKVITDLYAKEFARIEHGEPLEAVEAAKDMVRQWV